MLTGSLVTLAISDMTFDTSHQLAHESNLACHGSCSYDVDLQMIPLDLS